MRNRMVWLLALVAWTMAGRSFAAEECSAPVTTASGQVQGIGEGGVCAWKGIPFATPPVGDLRWKAPQAMPAWSGVRDATAYGHFCMQGGGLFGGGGAPGAGMSEDCLNLNIWRPKTQGSLRQTQGSPRLPVMFWVHGGGYYTGAGNEPQYWGDRLAENGGVLVVTINYRLSVFGFMAHPGLREEDPNRSTGGYGTLDQVFALKWVKDNIAGFGGDPDNITIFGQSAGGASICTLIATPLAKGLFHRAIMESGLCELSQELDTAYSLTRESVDKLGCGFDDLACLRKLPAETIIKKASGSLLNGFTYSPCHDGYILTGTPLAMIQSGHYNRAQIMAGTVLDEFGKAVKLNSTYYYTQPKDYEKRLQKSFEMNAEQAARLAGLYPLASYDHRPVEAMGRAFGTDAVMQCPAHRCLIAMANGRNDTWFYRFDYHGMKMGKYIGSYHSAELPFVFMSFDRGSSNTFYKGKDLTHEKELSRVMQGYWSNFARTGNPNGTGLPEWKPFSPADQRLQVLNTTAVENQPAGVEERCEFWQEYSTDFMPMANKLIKSLF